MERIISGIESIFRPTAKALIKGGIVFAEAVSEFASGKGGQFKDLRAEAKTKLEKPESQETETGKSESRDRHKKRSARTVVKHGDSSQKSRLRTKKLR
jgi:hypothetical protein